MRRFLLITLLTVMLAAVCVAAHAEIVINEVMLSTATYTGGHAYEWVELYNNGSASVDLKGMTLTYTRKGNVQSYTIRHDASLKAGKYAVIYFTDGDEKKSSGTTMYCTFDVSSKGGTIDLYDTDGVAVSSVTLGKQYCDISYGLVRGTGDYKYLEEPTRGEKNAARGYDERCGKPLLMGGGFYDECPPVYVMAQEGDVVRYTTDGSEPTGSSPLWVDGVSFSRGVTALRIRSFSPDKLPSETVTQSFFVGISYDIPIVSLITDNAYTFSKKTGSLVKGVGAKANYLMKWEYPINVEYYNQQHTQELNQMATFRVSGATSRKFGQKAISLFARGALGKSSFKFNPFKNREGYTSFKSFTLRAGGTECTRTRFKDALLTGLAEGEGIMYQEAVPCLVYINGEFYGLANIREKVNKHSLAAWEGITDEDVIDRVTIVKGRTGVQNGSLDEWKKLVSYMKSHSLAKEENLQYVMDRMDVDNYLTMVAFEMITGNNDIGNQRLYKFEGGKFKWVLYDLDVSMEDTERMPIGVFYQAIDKENKLFYHEPFAALMKNASMRDRFLTICGDLMVRKFTPDYLTARIDEWVAAFEPYMPMQIKRWPGCSPKAMSSWNYAVNAFRKVAVTRPRAVMRYLMSAFQLSDEKKSKYFGAFNAILNQ